MLFPCNKITEQDPRFCLWGTASRKNISSTLTSYKHIQSQSTIKALYIWILIATNSIAININMHKDVPAHIYYLLLRSKFNTHSLLKRPYMVHRVIFGQLGASSGQIKHQEPVPFLYEASAHHFGHNILLKFSHLSPISHLKPTILNVWLLQKWEDKTWLTLSVSIFIILVKTN